MTRQHGDIGSEGHKKSVDVPTCQFPRQALQLSYPTARAKQIESEPWFTAMLWNWVFCRTRFSSYQMAKQHTPFI